MQAFEKIEAVVASLPIANVDTDMIIPKQFLKTIKRTGLGQFLFFEMRYDDNEKEIADFVLNKKPYRSAQILVSDENFGCGSSREHAPWSLLDFGIRCIIAPSFADIFFNNCFKNGILPVVLDKETCNMIAKYSEEAKQPVLTVDLPSQTITSGDGSVDVSFEVDPFRKTCLLEGLDDIGLTLAKADKIDVFEARDKANRPWMYAAGSAY